jgi:hypothetical protein
VQVHPLALRRPAAAAKELTGWSRDAVWAAPGVLAVSGRNEGKPAGLLLVDTRTWQARAVEPGASEVVQAGSTLVASGSGLSGYTLGGAFRFHLFGDEPVAGAEVAGGLVYLSGCNSFCHRVVDPRAGRLVADVTTTRQTVLVS